MRRLFSYFVAFTFIVLLVQSTAVNSFAWGHDRDCNQDDNCNMHDNRISMTFHPAKTGFTVGFFRHFCPPPVFRHCCRPGINHPCPLIPCIL